MLDKITKFFEDTLQISEETEGTNKIEFATAAIFLELANSDYDNHESETILIVDLLRKTFDLNEDELLSLIDLAAEETKDSHDLYQFTSLINKHFNNDEKIELLENCWHLAFADGRLDKYEEHFIRKIAGLINLPPSEFVKTKVRVTSLHN
ncbi:MAG: putative tellurite resistance protein B-like protein [Flavobacterium sp.]|jgi:uncharacterized tellurite resistance protein B-like protein